MDAVAKANSGDTITVAPGVYYGSIDFSGKALDIVSSGGAAVTTIYASPGHQVVYAGNGEGPGTVLDGFTLSGGGNATTPAIEEEFSSLTLKNDVITGTTGNLTVYARSSFMTLDHVTIDGTNTASDGMMLQARRGELILKDSDVTCGSIPIAYRQEHGSAMVDGSTIHCAGATAVSIFHSQGRVQRSVLDGLLDVEDESTDSEPTVVEGSVLLGGAYAYYTWVQLYNVVAEAAITLDYVSFTAENSVFTGGACGINATDYTAVSVSYSNFYGNTSNICGMADPVGTSGNIGVSPDFMGATDFHLASHSLLIDAGAPDAGFLDTDGTRDDIGAYGGPMSMDGGW